MAQPGFPGLSKSGRSREHYPVTWGPPQAKSPGWPQCLALASDYVQSTLALFYEKQRQSWHRGVPTMLALCERKLHLSSPRGYQPCASLGVTTASPLVLVVLLSVEVTRNLPSLIGEALGNLQWF